MDKLPDYYYIPPACQVWLGKSEANALYKEIKHVPADTPLGKWRDGLLMQKIDEMKDKETTYIRGPFTF